MNRFPRDISPQNRDNFPNIYRNIVKEKMRERIYEHLLANSESVYFDLDNFGYKHPELLTIRDELIVELTDLGWKCQLSYGGTALFIFACDVPMNCY